MVDNVLKKNQNIKSLEQTILVANKQIDISDNWNNPVLTFVTRWGVFCFAIVAPCRKQITYQDRPPHHAGQARAQKSET